MNSRKASKGVQLKRGKLRSQGSWPPSISLKEESSGPRPLLLLRNAPSKFMTLHCTDSLGGVQLKIVKKLFHHKVYFVEFLNREAYLPGAKCLSSVSKIGRASCRE